MDENDIDEIFKLAKLIQQDKEELKKQLEDIRASVKEKQETLRKLYQLLR
jgi:signal transduction histidine kinase